MRKMYLKGSFTVQVHYVVVYVECLSWFYFKCVERVRDLRATQYSIGESTHKMIGTIVVLPTINPQNLFYVATTFASKPKGAKNLNNT